MCFDKGMVSIVISTYDGVDTIVQCVESACSQDYSNFEVIVVDDNGAGSPNQVKTKALLQKYIDTEKIQYYFHEQNINGSAARNTGIKHSKGEFIAFLDDDDLLHQNSIRLRVIKLSEKGANYGIVFSSFAQYIKGLEVQNIIQEFDGDILFNYLNEEIHSPSSTLMIRKSIIEEIGLWDESFFRHQDWEFVTRICSKYLACSISDITVDRIVLWRNNAKKPELFEEQRVYFLDKMKPIICSLSPSQQAEVRFTHSVDIGKNYLKYKKLIKAAVWAKKSGDFSRALKNYYLGIKKKLKVNK